MGTEFWAERGRCVTAGHGSGVVRCVKRDGGAVGRHMLRCVPAPHLTARPLSQQPSPRSVDLPEGFQKSFSCVQDVASPAVDIAENGFVQSFGVETYDGDIEDEALGDATASRGWDEVDEDE